MVGVVVVVGVAGAVVVGIAGAVVVVVGVVVGVVVVVGVAGAVVVGVSALRRQGQPLIEANWQNQEKHPL